MKAEEHANNLDALRLFAAFLVLVSHGWALLGLAEADFVMRLTRGGFSASWLGLAIFFSISGFLIDRSAHSSKSWKAFARRRFLRLWPGLTCVILGTVFVIGPILGTLPIAAYFTSLGTWTYLASLTLWGMRWNVPGLFQGNPVQAVNGSLWTLPYEATFYLMSWAYRKTTGFVHRWAPMLLFSAGLLVRLFAYEWISAIPFRPVMLSLPFVLDFGLLYLGGTILNRVWKHQRIIWSAFIVLAVLWIACLGHEELRRPLDFLVLPMGTLLVGFRPLWPFNRLGRVGDFSYGLYIWGFPAQQVLVHFLGVSRLTPWSLAWGGALLALPFAVASWYLIEKRSLARKDIPLRLGRWSI